MTAVASTHVLSVAAGGERLAMPADEVVEVAPAPVTTRLPHAPAGLRGLANVRGSVVPVVSLAELLGRKVGKESRLVLLGGAKPVGLLVDEVSALRHEVGSARLIEPRPLLEATFAGLARNLGRTSTPIDRAGDAAAGGVASVALLAFSVAGQEFGLPLDETREVLRVPAEIAALPHGRQAVVGTAAHRDRLVPLLDLRVLLGLGEGARGDQPRVLLTHIGRHLVGLLVDSVDAVLHVPETSIDPLPTVLARDAAEARIQAICRLDGGKRLISVLSSERLLDDQMTVRLTQEGSHDMRSATTSGGDEENILLFTLGDDAFGLPISAVREVTRRPEQLTRLPRSPAFVDGIMNLRGQVLPVIDQRRRFGSDADDGARRPVVVVTIGDTQAGFVVDSVSRVAAVPASALQPAPDLGDEGTPVIDRVATLEVDGRLVLLVNPQELLDRAERDLLVAMDGRLEAQRRP